MERNRPLESDAKIAARGEKLVSETPETPVGKAQPTTEEPLGKYLAGVRERRGVSQADAAKEAKIPPHYVRMIESEDYSLISDQLYLLPFLRRYAAFVGLDPEEVASRFVRDVQRADLSASRMSGPVVMLDRKSARWKRISLLALAALLVLIALGIFLRLKRASAIRALPAPPRADAGVPQTLPAAPTPPSASIAPAPVTLSVKGQTTAVAPTGAASMPVAP